MKREIEIGTGGKKTPKNTQEQGEGKVEKGKSTISKIPPDRTFRKFRASLCPLIDEFCTVRKIVKCLANYHGTFFSADINIKPLLQ